MVSKVFLDVNILLDFFLKRKDFDYIEQILLSARERNIIIYVSSSIIQTTSYYLQKSFDTATCKSLLKELLKIVNVIEASYETVSQALNSSINDIEDAIHYYTAIKNKMDYLISSDVQFQKSALSSLPILSINELHKKLAL